MYKSNILDNWIKCVLAFSPDIPCSPWNPRGPGSPYNSIDISIAVLKFILLCHVKRVIMKIIHFFFKYNSSRIILTRGPGAPTSPDSPGGPGSP